MSQSAGSGLASVASVTGTNVCAEAFAANAFTDAHATIIAIMMWDARFIFSSQCPIGSLKQDFQHNPQHSHLYLTPVAAPTAFPMVQARGQQPSRQLRQARPRDS